MSFTRKYAITKRGRFPYIGSSWVRAGMSPQLYDSVEDAEEACEKLSEVNPVGFCVISVDYDLSEEGIRELLKKEAPQCWWDLHEYIVGHSVITIRGKRI